MSLPLSLEIVATDISLCDNEGAVRKFGVMDGTTGNASCSELRDLRSRGAFWDYMLGVPGPVGTELRLPGVQPTG